MIAWTNQQQFFRSLQLYQVASRKSFSDILANEAKWFSIELFNEFKKLSPSVASIAKAAVTRKFAMGRKASSMVAALRGLSQASITRAKALLEGQKSDWFKVSVSPEGAPIIKRARFSARGKNKLLRGGRFGNRFAPSALRASQFDADNRTVAHVMRHDLGLKQLNERALGTAIEIGYRARAAKGHFMGVQWLPKVYQNRSSSVVKRGPLVANTRGGKKMGIVEFFIGGDGEITTVRLSGLIPGTEAMAAKHGIVNKVAQIRASDRHAYVLRKLAGVKREAAAISGGVK